MKLEMHKNSLFAILLRSPWWISIVVGGVIVAVASFFVPAQYGFFVSLPFFGIGAYAGWQQLRAPSETRVADTIEALRAMSWGEFSSALDEAFRRDGYDVSRVRGAAADFELTKGGRTSLVSCKRWKVARTGVEPLRELYAAKRARDAQECLYVAAGDFTDSARTYAAEQGVRLVHGADLVKLLPRIRRSRKQPA